MATQIGKQALINSISERSDNLDLSKKDIGAVFDRIFDSIVEHLRNGEKIVIPGIFSVVVKLRNERKCINPQTKQVMMIPSSNALSFKTSSSLKLLINKEK
ncbi:MAG TPA: HU family DNA-binding protein [Mycoplasmatales bacterium]|jgi:nucleoid DNA-binding protein|nr:HU family DNA-binding protein [Mycoplasmatales bacterium]